MTALPSDFAAMAGVHTAGIYADMTVDGPEIGTLVVIVDRAKNLPNRKTMGKQNPYCAARLGKEAKKTETDKRGGQTPKWDQELRFTVHESLDYNNLKVSVFNDDKKTDLIGEMWVNLDAVVVPGGGKMDGWHQLACKGKYAGEVMLELTYYDSRPDERGDQIRHDRMMMDKKIKRRPLPTENLHTTPLPHQMENTRTAGPRAMGSRPRTSSSMASNQQSAPPVQHPNSHNQYPHDYPPAQHYDYPPNGHHYDYSHMDRHEYPPVEHHDYPPVEHHDYHPGYQPRQHSMPDLPELPPSSRRQRGSLPPLPRNVAPQSSSPYHGRSQSHPELPHSHSAPAAVPQAHDPYAYPQPRTPRTRGYAAPSLQPTVEDEMEDLPPLPPSHAARAPPARSQSVDYDTPLPLQPSHSTPNFRKSYSGPSSPASSPAYPGPSPNQRLPPRHAMTEPYNTVTPPRAHPLANAMHPDDLDHYGNAPPEPAPIIKPRAISPAPNQSSRNSLASIRHPVRTFATQNSSAPASPADSTQTSSRSVPRKSVSPRPSTSGSGGAPFSPDDYSSFNPNASLSSRYTQSQSTDPRSPYYIPNTPQMGSEEPDPAHRPLPDPEGPITTWDGRTVDPSDHLPVHSWAPEPVKKTPEKQYGSAALDPNRPRGLSGPRQNVHSVPSSGGRVGRDVVVNVRSKHASNPGPYDSSPNGRDRMRHGGRPASSHNLNSHSQYSLSEIDARNSYYQDVYAPDEMQRYQSRSPAPYAQQQQQQQQQPQQRHYGDLFGGNYENGGSHYAGSEYSGGGRAYSEPPPQLPPKIPFDDHGYGVSALEKELSRIDIGSSSSGTVARKSRWRKG